MSKFNIEQTASINQGLEGVIVAATKIADVNGQQGELVYAGYTMEEISA